ncbi:MAG TPA: M67 family metallopeptidase [Solirubrobacterales bacterium]
MKISQELVDEMVAHAREDLPNECCGLVGGKDGVATKVVRVVNAAATPLRYEMDSQGQLNALNEIEADGELLAIYHSHTKSAAYPSQTDVNQAQNWPEPIYVIISLADSVNPDVQGFHLADLKIADAELEIG